MIASLSACVGSLSVRARLAVSTVLIIASCVAAPGCGGSSNGGPDDGGTTRRDGSSVARLDAGPEDGGGVDASRVDGGVRVDAAMVGPCTNSGDCDDGLFCNGDETCDRTSPRADFRGCVAATTPCLTGQRCDEAENRCVTTCGSTMDADMDGHASIDCGGDDCNDLVPTIHPGATDTCNGLDDDCDGVLEGPMEDVDRDGHPSRRCGGVMLGDDCDDNDPTTYVDAPELCDGRDNDCSRGGGVEPEDDGDGDHFAALTAPCTGGPYPKTDCDDIFASAHPGGSEVCNGADDDCDGTIDDGVDSMCVAANATSACRMGSCAVTSCAAGYDDCDLTYMNGCEAELATNVDHCGACGHFCLDGATCVSGACRPAYAWDRTVRGRATDLVHGVAIDPSGNVVVTVHAGDSMVGVDFGGGPIASPTLGGAYVASYTGAGVHRWSKIVATTNQTFPYGIATDASGNIYVVGSFRDQVTFAGHTAMGMAEEAFVASYDASGSERWLATFGSASDDSARAVAVDASGNVYVVGEVSGDTDFGSGMRTAFGRRDVFVASWTSAGAPRWSAIYGGDQDDALPFLGVTPAGDVLVGAQFNGTATFGGAALTTVGLGDIVVARFNAAGAHQWSRRFGGTAYDRVRGVTVDASANVYVTGDSGASLDFGGGPLSATMVGYVVSLDGTGAHRWSIPVEGGAYTNAALRVAGSELFAAINGIGMVRIGDGRLIPSAASGFIARLATSTGHSNATLATARERATRGSATAEALDISVGARLVVGGTLRQTVDWGGGPRSSDAPGDAYFVAIDL